MKVYPQVEIAALLRGYTKEEDGDLTKKYRSSVYRIYGICVGVIALGLLIVFLLPPSLFKERVDPVGIMVGIVVLSCGFAMLYHRLAVPLRCATCGNSVKKFLADLGVERKDIYYVCHNCKTYIRRVFETPS